jgi:predicted negative regulator of RcsB-dependent stress response
MKSTERHKLKENEFASALSRIIHWVTPRLNTILAAVGILILLVVALWIIRYQKETRNKAAGVNITKTLQDLGGSWEKIPEEKMTLLEEMGEKYKNTPAGAALLFRLGQHFAEEEDTEKAVKYYSLAASSLYEKDPVQLALSGIYVKTGEYDKAKEYLYKISKESPLYDNVLYLLYLCGKGARDESLAQKAANELNRDEYKESPYPKMLAIREVL